MAIINTTLTSPLGVNDSVAVVASSTGINAIDYMEIDGEVLQVIQTYSTSSNGVNVPVRRGQGGTVVSAHPSGAKVRIGAGSDTGWGDSVGQLSVQFPIATPARQRSSFSESGAITLPQPGSDMVAALNGTSALAMTVADPGTTLDGSLLWIASNGAAAHTVTFASGLSGAGGSYDVITVNATAPVLLGPFMAMNGFWQQGVTVPMAGTVTNITATVS